jgi:hypothetical protein
MLNKFWWKIVDLLKSYNCKYRSGSIHITLSYSSEGLPSLYSGLIFSKLSQANYMYTWISY